MNQNTTTTTAPVKPGDSSSALPEFGRWQDVQRLFGLKRGTLYGLLAKGKVRGVLQRCQGRKSGVRLFYLPGIREMLLKEMETQERKEVQ